MTKKISCFTNHSPAAIHAEWQLGRVVQTRNTLNRAGIRYMMDQNNMVAVQPLLS